jgi:hypothetical protein
VALQKHELRNINGGPSDRFNSTFTWGAMKLISMRGNFYQEFSYFDAIQYYFSQIFKRPINLYEIYCISIIYLFAKLPN